MQTNITSSILLSILYWFHDIIFRDYYGFDDNKVKYIKAIIKLLSILLLTGEYLPYQFNLALLFYCIGDFWIVFDEKTSLYFFMLGHIFFIQFFELSMMIVYVRYMIVLIIISTIIFHKIIGSPTPFWTYFFYILVLHLYAIIPLFHGHYAHLLFVLSDLLIGFNINHRITWPLYYLSILYVAVSYW